MDEVSLQGGPVWQDDTVNGSRCPPDGSPGSQGLQQGRAGTQDSGGKESWRPWRHAAPNPPGPCRLRAARTLRVFLLLSVRRDSFPWVPRDQGPRGACFPLQPRLQRPRSFLGCMRPSQLTTSRATIETHGLLKTWKFMYRRGSMVGSLLPPSAIRLTPASATLLPPQLGSVPCQHGHG